MKCAATEIAYDKDEMEDVIDISKDEILTISEGHSFSKELNSNDKVVDYYEIQRRLQDMELELYSILGQLKSTSDEIVPLVGQYYLSMNEYELEMLDMLIRKNSKNTNSYSVVTKAI